MDSSPSAPAAEWPKEPIEAAIRRPGGFNVHLYPSPLTHESRIMRICGELDRAGLFDAVMVVGVAKPGLAEHQDITSGFRLWRVPRGGDSLPGLFGRILKTVAWSWAVFGRLNGVRVTCLNCHSLALLPLCTLLKLRHRCRLVYDTHELETETRSMRGVRRPFMRLVERLLIRAADETSVVSGEIARWYAARYGLGVVTVVRNVPLAPRTESAVAALPRDILRKLLEIPEDHFVFLYVGVLNEGRRIEQFLRVFARLPEDRHVVFMGYGPLEAKVREAAMDRPNIHLVPAVPPEEVLRHTVGADVGLAGVENACLSYYYSLPNKLFEYMAAGVPSLVPDYPEMRRLCEESGCGWVVGESDEAWATRIAALTRDEISRAGEAAGRAARLHNWNSERHELMKIYRRLFGERVRDRSEASQA